MDARDFRDGEGLRALQCLVQDARALRGRANAWHVGDLAWQTASGLGNEPTWARRIWEEDGRVVAWGWLERPGFLGWQLDPRRPELLADVLEWFDEEATDGALQTSVLASDDAALDTLRAHGYEHDPDAPWFAYTARDLEGLPEHATPDGYTLRTVTEADVDARVDVHRAAWEPSQFTRARYLATRAAWPYREDLDCVAVAPDGRFASTTLCWYDDKNHVGELEPVGTRPSERRRGLSRATNLFALHQLRTAGAETAIVMCRGDDAYPIPKLLYESLGFRQHDRTLVFRKQRAPSNAPL